MKQKSVAVVGAAETTELGRIPNLSVIGLHADAALNAAESGNSPDANAATNLTLSDAARAQLAEGTRRDARALLDLAEMRGVLAHAPDRRVRGARSPPSQAGPPRR